MVERIIQLISQVGGIESVEPNEGFYDTGFSSVRALELLLSLEEEFGVQIPDKEFIAARTPSDVADLIERLQQTQAA